MLFKSKVSDDSDDIYYEEIIYIYILHAFKSITIWEMFL